MQVTASILVFLRVRARDHTLLTQKSQVWNPVSRGDYDADLVDHRNAWQV